MPAQTSDASDHSRVLGIFAKYWKAGTVKTRLAASVGEQTAADVYREFVRHLATKLRDVDAQRWIGFWPDETRLEFQNLAEERWKLKCQVNGDLGNRMKDFFESAFENTNQHHRKVVLIGSDSPWLDQVQIEAAFRALDETPVVIGPSEDGGYYLIGMNQPVTEIFDGIDWSTESVLSRTLAILGEQGIGHYLLAEGYDIDTVDDLERLLNSLKSAFEQQQLNPVDSDFLSQLEGLIPGQNRKHP